MTADKYIRTLILLLGLTLTACGQSNCRANWTIQGEKHAKDELKTALTDTTIHNVINPKTILLKDEGKAIEFAEQILFDLYGKKEIKNQRPYEAYNIDNYWVISGTLSKGMFGGTFLIIIDSRDCRVVRITHGK